MGLVFMDFALSVHVLPPGKDFFKESLSRLCCSGIWTFVADTLFCSLLSIVLSKLNCPLGHVCDKFTTFIMTYKNRIQSLHVLIAMLVHSIEAAYGVTKIRKNVEISKLLVCSWTSPRSMMINPSTELVTTKTGKIRFCRMDDCEFLVQDLQVKVLDFFSKISFLF